MHANTVDIRPSTITINGIACVSGVAQDGSDSFHVCWKGQLLDTRKAVVGALVGKVGNIESQILRSYIN